MPDFPDTPWFDLPPDWVCEVLSPGTRQLDLTHKRNIYLIRAIRLLLAHRPKARLLKAFEFRGGAWTLAASLKEGEVRLAPFKAIAFALSALWPD